MDANTLMLILFAAMMLFCCGGVGRFFSRRETGSAGDEASKGLPATGAATNGSTRSGGRCH